MPTIRLPPASATLAVAVLAAATPACAGAGGGRPDIRLDPVRVTARAPSDLQPVSFLVGCWRGSFQDGGTLIEERWSPPEGGLMLGTTRFLRNGRAVGWEFGHLAADSAGVVYTPYPGGSRSEHSFRLTDEGPGRALFEAPEHDYPTRIRYELDGEGVLRVTIDAGAGDGSPRSWSLERTTCDGGHPSPAASPFAHFLLQSLPTEGPATLPEYDQGGE